MNDIILLEIDKITKIYEKKTFTNGNCAVLAYYLNLKLPNINNQFIILYNNEGEVIHTAFSTTQHLNFAYDINGKNTISKMFKPYKFKENDYYINKYLFYKHKDYFLNFILPSTSYDISLKKELIDKRLQQTYLRTY